MDATFRCDPDPLDLGIVERVLDAMKENTAYGALDDDEALEAALRHSSSLRRVKGVQADSKRRAVACAGSEFLASWLDTNQKM
jgi:nickel-dependent lactate racemase